MAHGSQGDRNSGAPMWLVSVGVQEQVEKTTVLYRKELDTSGWQELPPLASRVIGITAHAGELVAWFKPQPGQVGGQWMWYSPSRYSTGPALPDRAEILTMAGDERSLWALGWRPRPAGSPATAPAATSDVEPPAQPATMPAADRPVLYQLTGDVWQEHAAFWPEEAAILPSSPFSLALVDGVPMLAVEVEQETIQILQYAQGAWKPAGALRPTPFPPRYFKLMSIDNKAALWAQPKADTPGPGTIKVLGGEEIELNLEGPPPNATQLAVGFSGGWIRLFYIDRTNPEALKLMEMRVEKGGSQPPTEIRAAGQGRGQALDWKTMLIMAVLLVVILNIVLRRRVAPKEDDKSDDET